MTTHTMKMALASDEDMNVAYDLLGLLDTIERDYYPADENDEDAPTHLDVDDPAHLRVVYDRLKAIIDRRGSGALHRVIGGFSTVRYKKNQILDLTQDVVALHPRLTAALDAVAAQGNEVPVSVIRKWPDGFSDRLEHVWKDLIGFIPTYKLYDLQRVLAEFGFAMKVYEVPKPATAHCTCPACDDNTIHASDCALHNAPALPVGPCDCGVAADKPEGSV